MRRLTSGPSSRPLREYPESGLVFPKDRALDSKTFLPISGAQLAMASQRKRPASPFSMKASQSATSVVGVNGRQTKARKTARVSNPTISTTQLRGIFFAECDGEKFVELTSLASRVQNHSHGGKALRAIWRRAGHDVLIPDIDGVRGVAFPGQRGHPREKLMPAAN